MRVVCIRTARVLPLPPPFLPRSVAFCPLRTQIILHVARCAFTTHLLFVRVLRCRCWVPLPPHTRCRCDQLFTTHVYHLCHTYRWVPSFRCSPFTATAFHHTLLPALIVAITYVLRTFVRFACRCYLLPFALRYYFAVPTPLFCVAGYVYVYHVLIHARVYHRVTPAGVLPSFTDHFMPVTLRLRILAARYVYRAVMPLVRCVCGCCRATLCLRSLRGCAAHCGLTRLFGLPLPRRSSLDLARVGSIQFAFYLLRVSRAFHVPALVASCCRSITLRLPAVCRLPFGLFGSVVGYLPPCAFTVPRCTATVVPAHPRSARSAVRAIVLRALPVYRCYHAVRVALRLRSCYVRYTFACTHCAHHATFTCRAAHAVRLPHRTHVCYYRSAPYTSTVLPALDRYRTGFRCTAAFTMHGCTPLR